MALAKKWKIAPIDIANFVAKQPKPEFISTVVVAKPGFINITLNKDFIGSLLSELQSNIKTFFPNDISEKIVIDYSSPNLAKSLHVGHLRSSIIGDSLVRIYQYMGAEVIRQNHVGDWGTQFGMILAYIKHENLALDFEAINISDLEVIYQKSKILYDESLEFADLARNYVVKLQANDKDVCDIWQNLLSVSLRHCSSLYDRLGLLLEHCDVVGESFYASKIPPILLKLESLSLLERNDGALCYFSKTYTGKDDAPLPMLIQKKDGGYLYSTTDIAAANYRLNDLNADRVLYVVDQRQSLHFNLLFELLEAMGNNSGGLKHVGFGTINDENGKPFKTRSGGTIKLQSLLDNARVHALKVIQEKQSALDCLEQEQLSEHLAIAAIKYYDLSRPRTSDYAFSYEQMLRLDGNTAPYILYAYVRLNKLALHNKVDAWLFTNPIELKLAKKIIKFSDVVEQAAKDAMPHYIAVYAYELAALAMKFYEVCPVNSTDSVTKNERQALCYLAKTVIRESLSLLGISTVEKM